MEICKYKNEYVCAYEIVSENYALNYKAVFKNSVDFIMQNIPLNI